MISHFWSDSFWLPANTTWADVSNGPGKTVLYAESKDFWFLIPLVILSLTLRFFCERYIFSPLGRYLRISDLKVKAPTNTKLEAVYKYSSGRKHAFSIAKQLDLSEQEVKRWWRLRRRQDKPTTLVKFCENLWKGLNFLGNVSFALYVVWGEDWMWDLSKCFEGYPHQGITPGLWWIYMLASSYYTSLIITQFRDVHRKDFWAMFIHHIATMLLFYCSWTIQCFRFGCMAYTFLDMGDILLEFGKAAKYSNLLRLVDYLFAVFVFSWITTRLVFLPFYLLPTSFKNRHLSPMVNMLNTLLYVIFALSLYWTWLIFKVVKRTIIAKEFPNDCRSSDSEADDDNGDSTQLTNTPKE